MTMDELLLQAVEQRLLRPLDVQFALMVAQNEHPAVMLAAAMILYFTVDDVHKVTVLVASIVGTLLHIGLDLFGSFFEKRQKSSATKLVGMAAFGSFMYLEVLDASFSLDGVIGAFAITNEIVLIIAGLGAGAMQPFARSPSLATIVPRVSSQLAGLAVGGYILFTALATWFVLSSNLILIEH